MDAPWLTSECYMYRRLQRLFDTTGPDGAWQHYDVFARRKHASFAVARDGIQAAARALQSLLQENPQGPLDFPGPTTPPEGCATAAHADAFRQVLHNALWGNQADLSLHVAFDGSGVRALEVRAQRCLSMQHTVCTAGWQCWYCFDASS